MSQQRSFTISLLLIFIGLIPLKAQGQHIAERPDSLVAERPDSVIVVNDSIAHNVDQQLEDVDSVVVIGEPPLIDVDSIAAVNGELVELITQDGFKPSSRKAVIYSAIFPGLGQIYNRKYWKLPIIYGGFVGVSYAVTWNHGHYTDYMKSYRSILRDDPEDMEWTNHLPYGRDPDSIDKKWFTNVLRDRKNYFRYYRDLSIIIAVGLYGLTIVDAYVDAQLFEFDITPDLSMRLEPAVIQRNDMTSLLAQGYGLRWSVSF